MLKSISAKGYISFAVRHPHGIENYQFTGKQAAVLLYCSDKEFRTPTQITNLYARYGFKDTHGNKPEGSSFASSALKALQKLELVEKGKRSEGWRLTSLGRDVHQHLADMMEGK